VERAELLDRGRQSYADSRWLDAHSLLSEADGTDPLGVDDLESLATAAALVGRDDEFVRVMERAHLARLAAGEHERAARGAVWIGLLLALGGAIGPASGWFGRAQRIVETEAPDCVERGYLLLPVMIHQEEAGAFEEALATAVEAGRIAGRFEDRDLLALALHEEGRVLVKLGRVHEGLARLDEAMVSVVAGELSPVVTGIVYCSVIEGCHEVFELRRAREWTEALTRWCAGQPQLVSFTGRCLVHRAELLQLDGAWPAALAEARRAGERCLESMNSRAAGEASYRVGEIHRLRGEVAEAGRAYREASRLGWEPQPGLALLRLAQGKAAASSASVRRAMGERTQPLARAAVLPAFVEIMLATGELDAADDGVHELETLAETFGTAVLAARAAGARGAVAHARGDHWAALAALRNACSLWQRLGAPYELARARLSLAEVCRELGDSDAATLEREAALAVLDALGAVPGLADRGREPGSLTAREVEVLRLVARGQTNREIASALVISEKTVARHVSNLFAKLGVSNRSAATAYAYERQLV
jgi:DNA-binding NarL/FixJ family response regulator